MDRSAQIDLSTRTQIVNSTKCTLNGKPARVVGIMERFPSVIQADHPWQRVEFCWPTVKRVMLTAGGAFQS